MWLHEFGQFVQPRVGNGDDTEIGLNGAEREVCTLSFGVRKTVEKGGLPDVGKANNTTAKTASDNTTPAKMKMKEEKKKT